MRILLWDIDGTLLDSGGAGMRSLASAVHASPPATEALRRMRLGGMTDRRIARLLCAATRHRADPSVDLVAQEALVTADEIDRVLSVYLQALRATVPTSEKYRVLPGVVAALDALDGRAIHALGTGNVEEGARIKLERAGLWSRFQFGGYGSDAEERSQVLRAGWTKAEKHLGRPLDADAFVVIGDTPRDIAAAHALGIACVAVAAGGYDFHQLAEHSPELLLPTLEAPGAAERILTARRTDGILRA